MSTSFSSLKPAEGEAISTFEYPDISSLPVVLTPWQEPEQEQEEPVPNTSAQPQITVTEEDIAQRTNQARAEGVRAGMEQARAAAEQQLQQERAAITKALNEFKAERAQYYVSAEKELVHLALAIARKILHREAQVDPLLMAGLVKVALSKLDQGTKVVARVRPDEVNDWTRSMEEQVTSAEVTVVADPTLQPRDCELETELGNVHLGLEAQLKEVEQGFFDLLAHRPE